MKEYKDLQSVVTFLAYHFMGRHCPDSDAQDVAIRIPRRCDAESANTVVWRYGLMPHQFREPSLESHGQWRCAEIGARSTEAVVRILISEIRQVPVETVVGFAA